MPKEHEDAMPAEGEYRPRRMRAIHILTAAGLAAAAGLTLNAAPQSANAAQKPTLAQARQQLQQLNNKVDQLDNQVNKAAQDMKAAQKQSASLAKAVSAERARFGQLHKAVAQMAATAYKTGDMGSVAQFVGAKDPQAVLDQVSIFTQLSTNRTDALAQYIASAQRLQREQAQSVQAVSDLAQKKSSLQAQEKQATSAIGKQRKLIVEVGGNISPGSTNKEGCSAQATGRAVKVLEFACNQIGDPYVFGGAGPNDWDCSGLTMVAWKQVGFNMDHYVPNQASVTNYVSKANLEPGDLVFFNNYDHVGLYIGSGLFVEAPHTGDVVKIASLNDSYYRTVFMHGGRPPQ
jgi:peptidoglycan DL-endopeptidase CwlO